MQCLDTDRQQLRRQKVAIQVLRSHSISLIEVLRRNIFESDLGYVGEHELYFFSFKRLGLLHRLVLANITLSAVAS